MSAAVIQISPSRRRTATAHRSGERGPAGHVGRASAATAWTTPAPRFELEAGTQFTSRGVNTPDSHRH